MDALSRLPDTRIGDKHSKTFRKAPALNNLGCAWMWFCEWDLAEKALRDALTPVVHESDEHPPHWQEGDPRPRSAKEAADHNLDVLSRARDAWMRGS